MPRLGPGNTTIGVVATNGTLRKEAARHLATVANDAVDHAVVPAHTLYDGDTVFTVATGEVEADVATVGRLAAPAVATAIRRAVKR